MGRLTHSAQRPMNSGPGTIQAPELSDLEASNKDRGWIVTVYDNDVNTFPEVIAILIMATGCTYDEAYMETWEVHHLGRSVVHHGGEDACRSVAQVIATIGIRVEATKED